VELESAIYQWRAGERALETAAPERRAVRDVVVAAIVAELRRRLGGRFAVAELVELYAGSSSWCLQLAAAAAPDAPWAWDSANADAAFARYARDAVDYAGGRYATAS
jgi:hypothetical protein